MRTRTSGLILAGMCFGLFGVALARSQDGRGSRETGTSNRHVQQDRLWATLQKLAEFGKNPEGGVSRVGFTDADLAGRAYAMSLMREAGLVVSVDPAGNIFGRRPGSEKLPLLLFGSHIDSVPHGGNYDGDVGTLGAIEVIRALNEERLTTRHPLEVVIWTTSGRTDRRAASGKSGPRRG